MLTFLALIIHLDGLVLFFPWWTQSHVVASLAILAIVFVSELKKLLSSNTVQITSFFAVSDPSSPIKELLHRKNVWV